MNYRNNLANSPLIRNKQKIEQDALQKMYLLTEPAFKKAKQHLDSDKFLSNYEKSIKSVLFDKKIPPYKKWMKYQNLVFQYALFKKFLEQSRSVNDDESTNKLLQLEKRIKEL